MGSAGAALPRTQQGTPRSHQAVPVPVTCALVTPRALLQEQPSQAWGWHIYLSLARLFPAVSLQLRLGDSPAVLPTGSGQRGPGKSPACPQSWLRCCSTRNADSLSVASVIKGWGFVVLGTSIINTVFLTCLTSFFPKWTTKSLNGASRKAEIHQVWI